MNETTIANPHRPTFRPWVTFPVPTCWSVDMVHFRVRHAGAQNLNMFSSEGRFIGMMEESNMYMVWDTMVSNLKCDIYRMS